MNAPVAIFFVGNPSRGDDAIGPILHGRLEKWLENEKLGGGFTLIEDFQLQIEHALDLAGRSLVLFVDAGERTPAPFVFAPIFRSTVTAHTTHALSPEAVLNVYWQTEGNEPPPSFVLCVRGASFGLGDAPSKGAETAMEAAFEWLKRLCRRATPAAWRMLATPAG